MATTITWAEVGIALNNNDAEKIAEYRASILESMRAKALEAYVQRKSIQSLVAATWGDVLLKLQAHKDNAMVKFQLELLAEFARQHGLTAYTDVSLIQPGDTIVKIWKDKKKINTTHLRVLKQDDKAWLVSLSMYEHWEEQFWAHERIEKITGKDFLVGVRQKTPPIMRKPQKFYLINFDNTMELNLTGFETAIKQFLDNLACEDTAFAETYYNKPNKSISECCKYICQEVEKNRKGAKCVACSDEEVFGLAIHYYDEDDIVVDGPKAKVETVAAPQPVTTAEPTETPAETPEETPAPKPKRTRKKAAPVDPDIPDALEIPLF